ncbi:MAG: TetR/AcrR family transcriptional regulator [Chloroflexota bacterium]|nr:TetR/AcrR family transcriptional regulator [Chloroflexota bacterium]
MPEPRRGRAHDAEGAREAILNAAEEVFAEHGFDGARIAVIAAVANYNSSLIFQYFDDKLGLYAAVLKRTDKEMSELQMRVFAPLLEGGTIASNIRQFKALLETVVQILFDYLIEHPRFMRMMLWEMAEGWQTYAQLSSQLQTEDVDQFELFFRKAQSAGLLRSDFIPVIQLAMALQVCQSYLAFLPLYQMLLPGEDVSSAAAFARAREYVVDFVVAGLMVSPGETEQ